MQRQEHAPSENIRAQFECAHATFAVATFESDSVVYRQGDADNHVMFIEAGRVRLGVIDSDGREGICGLLGAGAFLGEEALAGLTARRHTAVALVPTRVLVFATADLRQLLSTDAAIADRFLAHVVWRHTHLEADLVALMLDSSERRLARMLLVLAEFDARRPCRCALPEVSQEILAEMVGTTRSRVNRFLSKFKKLGLVEARGRTLLVTPQLQHMLNGGRRQTLLPTARDARAIAV